MKKLLFHIAILLFLGILKISSSHFQFLILNIFLALIPLEIVWIEEKIHQKMLFPFFFILWLLFYPNSLYMITDFAHLSNIGVNLQTVSHFKNFAILGCGIMIGFMSGLLSNWLMQQAFRRYYNWDNLVFVVGFQTVIALLTSLAIYIGRFLRFHTIDLFRKPLEVIQTITAHLSQGMLGFVLWFTIFQLFVVGVYQLLTSMASSSKSQIS